jgi:hypothetical protein
MLGSSLRVALLKFHWCDPSNYFPIQLNSRNLNPDQAMTALENARATVDVRLEIHGITTSHASSQCLRT